MKLTGTEQNDIAQLKLEVRSFVERVIGRQQESGGSVNDEQIAHLVRQVTLAIAEAKIAYWCD